MFTPKEQRLLVRQRSAGNQVTREQCAHLFFFSLPGCKPLACGWQAQAGRRQRLGEETGYRKAEDREEKAVGEIVHTFVFSITTHGRWTAKRENGDKMDSFGTRCWRNALQIPWTARKMNK